MWSELHLDMLILISKGLALDDFIRFSSVCRSWRYVYTVTKHNHDDKAPWLMYSGGEEEPNTAIFYSMSHKKELKIGNQPGCSLHKRIFLGSARGWLITADEKSELSLVNPFTRQQIDLPPVTTFGCFLPFDHDAYGEVTHYRCKYGDDEVLTPVFTAEELRYFSYAKATLACCGGGKVEDDYTVVVILPNLYCIAFARSGDKKWTTLTDYIDSRESISSDVNEAKVYTISYLGMVECWDFSRKNHVPEPVICFPEDLKFNSIPCEYMFYLVQTPWGDVWHVRRRKKGNPTKGSYLTRKIWIYKFDFAKEKLIHVKSIGDYVLFIGGGTMPLCISCKDNPNLRPNSVYFLDDDHNFDIDDNERMFRRDIGIYCFDDRRIEHIMPQNSLLKWPPPVWLQPPIV